MWEDYENNEAANLALSRIRLELEGNEKLISEANATDPAHRNAGENYFNLVDSTHRTADYCMVSLAGQFYAF